MWPVQSKSPADTAETVTPDIKSRTRIKSPSYVKALGRHQKQAEIGRETSFKTQKR